MFYNMLFVQISNFSCRFVHFLSFSFFRSENYCIFEGKINVKNIDMTNNPSFEGLKTGFSFTKPQNTAKSEDKVSVNTPNKSTPSPRGHA